MKTMPTDHPQIALKSSEGEILVNPKEVLYVSSDFGRSLAKLTEGREIKILTALESLELSLNNEVFCRINHSEIINLGHVLSRDSLDGREIILMSNEHALKLAPERKTDFDEKYTKFNQMMY